MLLHEQFHKYCLESDPAAMAYWQEYLLANPKDKALLERAKLLYKELYVGLADLDLEEQKRILSEKIQVNGEAPVIRLKNKGVVRKNRILAIAASLLLLLAVGWLWVHTISGAAATAESQHFAANPGERKHIQLQDGSVVRLNGGSQLVIPSGYGKEHRRLELAGEAFFEVQHNTDLPFIVKTELMAVKAVGTSFNVKAYPNSGIDEETTLISGKVLVALKNKADTFQLLPNQKIKVSRTSDALLQKNIAAVKPADTSAMVSIQPIKQNQDGDVKEIAWMDDKLIFTDESFEEIVVSLERWFGVKISFEDELPRNYRFTGSFQRLGLQDILEILQETRSFNYQIEENGKKVTIQK